MWTRTLPGLDIKDIAWKFSDRDGFVWLDSAAEHHPLSRYSYLCADPIAKITCPSNNRTPDALENFLKTLSSWTNHPSGIHTDAHLDFFHGGAVGYFSYDFGRGLLKVSPSRHGEARGALAEFGFYDTIIVFDHLNKRGQIVSHGLKSPLATPDQELANARISSLSEIILSDATPQICESVSPDWQATINRETYTNHFRRLIEYILDGDIYQANYAQAFTAHTGGEPNLLSYYLALRQKNAAPFGCFGNFTTRSILSASPERLFSLNTKGLAETRPIKGTIRRSDTASQDERLKSELLSSEKDRAENIMIVDLLRNDLSVVCEPGSVQVQQLCGLETYAGLHHLTSVVHGKLKSDLDATDMIRAIFPGGSITGAPKERAVEIIDELEAQSRGVFCGALGYIGLDGRSDFNILIRTAEILENTAHLHVGSGITLMSSSDAEFEETLLKASRFFEINRQPECAQ